MVPYITFKLSRELPVPVALFHPDKMGPGPGTDTASLSSGLGGQDLVAPQHSIYPTPLSIWAYLAIAFVILALAAVISYMIYSCYHTAGLRVRLKTGTGVGVAAGAGGVKGGWQNLEDPSGETVVERGEGRLSKGLDVGEKVDVDYRDKHKTDGMIRPWSERSTSSLKGLGIQLERKPQYDFTSQPNESQASILPGSPRSTSSLGSTSDHEHEQDIESSEGSDCPSMSAEPLAHTTERSTYHPFNVPPPLPIPLPLPVTPSPPTQEQQVKQKRTRLRALTQILAYNLMQNQNGRDTYFELQPMMKQAEKGAGNQSNGLLSETPDELSPPSPLSSSQFAFFAPYPNCNSTSMSNTDSNATTFTSNSWGNNISGATSTPITPLTPITPMTPVTPMKPGPTGDGVADLRFDSNNIQFIETPPRISDASSGVGASPSEVQGTLGAASNSLARADMWNDPKLSPVQGAPLDLDEGKTSLVKNLSPTEIVVAKTRVAGASKLTRSTVDLNLTSLPGHVPAPTLATLDQVLHGHANLRLGYLRRGVSLSSPPSPSPSSRYSDSSSDSACSSPSIATVRFTLDRGELKRDNLRNRDRVGLGREKKESMKVLSPIPRPVFVLHTQPSQFSSSGQPF